MTDTNSRGRCWALRRPDATAWNPELDEHHPNQTSATTTITDLTTDYGPDATAGVRATPLEQSCALLDCDSCGEPLGDDDGFAVLHFNTRAQGERWAEQEGWSSDGRRWHCTDCEPLTRPGDLAAVPVCPGQGVLPGMDPAGQTSDSHATEAA